MQSMVFLLAGEKKDFMPARARDRMIIYHVYLLMVFGAIKFTTIMAIQYFILSILFQQVALVTLAASIIVGMKTRGNYRLLARKYLIPTSGLHRVKSFSMG